MSRIAAVHNIGGKEAPFLTIVLQYIGKRIYFENWKLIHHIL